MLKTFYVFFYKFFRTGAPKTLLIGGCLFVNKTMFSSCSNYYKLIDLLFLYLFFYVISAVHRPYNRDTTLQIVY